MPVQTPVSADVSVGDATKAPVQNLLRDDVQQALRATDFGTDAQIQAITPAVGDAAIATDTGTFYICRVAGTWATLQGGGTVSVGRGHIDRLALSVAAGDTLTLGISTGVCRSDDTGFSISFTTALTKNLADVFATGTGNGGRKSGDNLDTNKWFYVYAIFDEAGVEANDIYVTVDKNWVSPITLPTDFDRQRYIGAIHYTHATAEIEDFFQRGDFFRFKAPQTDVTADSAGTGGTFKTGVLTVPSVEDGVLAHLLVHVVSGGGGGGATGGIVRTPGAGDAGIENAVVVPGGAAEYCSVLTNEDGEIESTILGVWSSITITVLGWEDQRGKNAA